MEGIALVALFVVFFGVIFLTTTVGVGKGKRLSVSSAKFPPIFSTSLSSKEVLSVVEARLQTIESIRTKWKTTEKVEKVGRLQSMMTVPYNLAGDNIRISFLMNLLATSKEAGGCTVEWNYVTMSPLNNTPPEIALLEDEIFKLTTLETRAALFIAQGDEEEADYLETKAKPVRKEIEIPASLQQLKSNEEVSAFVQTEARKEIETLAPEQELFEDSLAPKEELIEETFVPQRELFEESPIPQIEVPEKPDAPEVSKIPGTPLPDIVGEALRVAAGTTGDPTLMQTPEFQSVSLGGTPNPLNFSPPDPALSSGASATSNAKCVKCSQARDLAFNFCLYCGHADA